MRQRVLTVATAGMLIVGLAACENSVVSKRTQGQVLGGVGGAVVGSQLGGGTGRILATGAGAVAGAVIGGELAD